MSERIRLARRTVLTGLGAALAAPATLRAQSWPTGPIRLIVPFAPGGTTDVMARLVGDRLGPRLGQPVIAENRAGAGATVGSTIAAQAAPDGQTLVMSNIASHGIAPTLYRNIRYDAMRDFVHIALVTRNPSAMVCNPGFAARSLADVVRIANEKPGSLDFATSGAGSSNHLLGLRFAMAAGITLNHVPYRGAGPAMTDTIAGVVPIMFDGLPSASGHIRAERVRLLATSGAERSPAFPDAPTFKESGFDVVSYQWFGISAPAGTPAAIVDRLNREIREILKDPEVVARFDQLGGGIVDMTPEQYSAFVAEEIAVWAPVVRASGATVE
ncbi:tripartite tricarboxylate transporter substrate binding protein [Elioraea tepidiphila]|jgi:tripartite-type tricarboxylate transporter receptor subunit TctC|uniref:Bug family tripartite tricarboxylate transporter substrate binding protein n=1 Tax=Elioraea tepidiphila TaxID=457934 RepID=UPI002FD93719